MVAKKTLEEKITNFYRSCESYFAMMERTHHLSNYQPIFRILKEKRVTFKNKKVLDVGSGSGSFLKLLKKKYQNGFKAVGTDISPLGRRYHQEKKIDFVLADARKLPFKASSFDFVFSIDILEHLLKPEQAVLEMFRVTKKKGLILIRTRNYRSPLTTFSPFSILGTFGNFLGKKKDLSQTKTLVPELAAKGGDKDAVAAIMADQFLNSLNKIPGEVLVFETWTKGGPWKIFNQIPMIKYLGSMCLVLFRKEG